MKHSDNTQKQKEPYMMKGLLNLIEDFTRRQKNTLLVNNMAKNDDTPL